MHAVFIPYGKIECVETLIRDLRAQKLTLRCYKEGEKDVHMFITCQVRILPFGVYEFVFPKEHADVVLTSLDFHKPLAYGLDKEIKLLGMKIKPLDYAKKYLRIENIPEFKTDKALLLERTNVSILPIGVRYDGEIEEEHGEMKGFKHEAI